MSISMRASQRRATLALIAVIAASCALPGYEVGETSASASSASASSTGGGGPSTAASTGGGGGQGGQNTGGEGGSGGDPNSTCVQDALNGAPCMVNGDQCLDKPPSGCEFLAKCEQNEWIILKSGEHCPSSDLKRLEGASCACEQPKFCKVTKDCAAPNQQMGQLAVCDDANKTWTVYVSPAVCCGPSDVCHPAKEVCVHVQSLNGQVMSACKPNDCASQGQELSCMGCGEALCPDGCTCEIPAVPENHVKCGKCP